MKVKDVVKEFKINEYLITFIVDFSYAIPTSQYETIKIDRVTGELIESRYNKSRPGNWENREHYNCEKRDSKKL